jgi:hypothetical protein
MLPVVAGVSDPPPTAPPCHVAAAVAPWTLGLAGWLRRGRRRSGAFLVLACSSPATGRQSRVGPEKRLFAFHLSVRAMRPWSWTNGAGVNRSPKMKSAAPARGGSDGPAARAFALLLFLITMAKIAVNQ